MPKLLANIVQFASCVCPIAIVVSSHEDLLSSSEDIIRNVHGRRKFAVNGSGSGRGVKSAIIVHCRLRQPQRSGGVARELWPARS